MKSNHIKIGCLALAVAAAITANQTKAASLDAAHIPTYQGRLDDLGGGPADGLFNFNFKIVIPPVPCFGTDCGWFTNCNLCAVTDLGTVSAVVTKGLFTTQIPLPPPGLLQSPEAIANGAYLLVAVRTNSNGNGNFTTLWPAQPMTPTPYASVAQAVSGPIQASSLIGTMPTGMLTGIFGSPLTFSNPSNVYMGNGSLLTGVNATSLGGYGFCNLPCYWNLTGNTGTNPGHDFVGTKDNTNLVVAVRGYPAIRIYPADPDRTGLGSAPLEPAPPEIPNIVGGFSGNAISTDARGATIAGGGSMYDHVFHGFSSAANVIGQAGDFSFVGSGSANFLKGPHNSIVGGHYNRIIDGNYSVIAGGGENLITAPVDAGAIVAGVRNSIVGNVDTNYPSGDAAFIGAGHDNMATNLAAFIGAGGFNLAAGKYSVVTGGEGNQAGGLQSSVGGGWHNIASGWASVVPGGEENEATGSGTFAAGTRARAINDGSFAWADRQSGSFATDQNNQFAVRAQNGVMIQGTTTALDLRGNGAIRVAGAAVNSSGPVFIHRASAASISGHITTIDHPQANGDPNAILLVTHNFSADSSSTPYEPNTVGVWYNGSKWTIYHENTSAPMPVGRAFNVMIIKP